MSPLTGYPEELERLVLVDVNPRNCIGWVSAIHGLRTAPAAAGRRTDRTDQSDPPYPPRRPASLVS
jgi:hypothetical protein